MIELFRSHQPLLVSIGLTLTHFIWQGVIVAALLAVVLRLLRGHSVQARYLACGCAMVVMVACLPVTFSLVGAGRMAVGREQQKSPATITPLVSHALDTPQTDGPLAHALDAASLDPKELGAASPADTPIGVDGHAGVRTERAPSSASGLGASWWENSDRRERVFAMGLSAASVMWGGCVIVLGLRLIGGWAVLRRWQRDAGPIPADLVAAVDRLRAALALCRSVRMGISSACVQPLAFGLLRPMVLLPVAALTELPPALLEAMIAHELAHIRRYDLWVNLLQRVVEIMLFYHPAVWWVSGRMRLERELCCDDLAIRATGRRVEYAESLVALARRPNFTSAAALAVGMFGSRTTLAARVREILQLPAPPERTRAWLAGPLSVTVLSLLVIAAAVAPSLSRSRLAAAEPAAATTRPAPAARVLATPQTMHIQLDFANVPLEKAVTQFAEQAGLPLLGLGAIDPGSKQKPIHLIIPKALPFDEALTTFDEVLFRQNFWMTLDRHGLLIDQLTEWYRFIPPDNWFASEAAYRAASLPGWAIAKVHYQPQGDAQSLSNLVADAIPVNGARVMMVANGSSFNLTGFVHFIDRQLAILAKWDVPGMPVPAPAAKAPMGMPGGKPMSGARSTTQPSRETGAEWLLPVRAMADGVIVEVPVQSGQRVEKGNVLVKLDDAELRLELEKAAIAARQAEEALRHKLQALMPDGKALLPKSELRKAETEVQLAQIELKRLELRIDRTSIRSPASGIVRTPTKNDALGLLGSNPLGLVGSKVSAGDQLLAILIDSAPPATQPAAATGEFGPVIERVVNDDGARQDFCIDLETGKHLTPPKDITNENGPAWARATGADVMGDVVSDKKEGLQRLVGFDMIAVPVVNDQWNAAASFIRLELARVQPGKFAVMSGRYLPMTFLIKTREGSEGVLQIIDRTSEPRGFRMRYKFLKPDTAKVETGKPQ